MRTDEKMKSEAVAVQESVISVFIRVHLWLKNLGRDERRHSTNRRSSPVWKLHPDELVNARSRARVELTH